MIIEAIMIYLIIMWKKEMMNHIVLPTILIAAKIKLKILVFLSKKIVYIKNMDMKWILE